MRNNRQYLFTLIATIVCVVGSLSFSPKNPGTKKKTARRPNILFVISDDQSFPYASVYGTAGVQTPAFDEVAGNGMLFYNAFSAAPQCSPSRAAILTGKNIWQLEEAGTHSSYFPKKFTVFTDLMENSGYAIGFTGKPWAPGNWKDAGWKRNPVGPEFNEKKLHPPTKYISNTDYYRNFVDFFSKKKNDQPFFFWYGAHEPHRTYEKGSGKKSAINILKSFVPGFLPSDTVVQSDIADYDFEIEWFDQQLGKMINFLREKGELENTLIVVTSDNGMPFPSAKANLLEYGCHVPLAISWPGHIAKGSTCDQLVSLIDLAPTFLRLAGIDSLPEMTGKSLTDVLLNGKNNAPAHRSWVLTGRERHSDSRPDDLGYPSRAIRTNDFLFILNLKPDRWPAGNPPADSEKFSGLRNPGDFKSVGIGYNDIDDPNPTKNFMLKYKDQFPGLFSEGFDKRPEAQLFDIKRDAACTNNLADNPQYTSVKKELEDRLKKLLTEQGDPRMLGNGDIFDSYPRFGLMRNWPGFQERGKYNPAFQNKRD